MFSNGDKAKDVEVDYLLDIQSADGKWVKPNCHRIRELGYN
jgi:hypothetical protein